MVRQKERARSLLLKKKKKNYDKAKGQFVRQKGKNSTLTFEKKSYDKAKGKNFILSFF